MTKKQKILIFMILVPVGLAFLYDWSFSRAGTILEDYQYYVKTILLLISTAGLFWLSTFLFEEKKYIRQILTTIVAFALLAFVLIGLSLTNINFP